MKKPIVDTIKSTMEIVKDNITNPLRDRIRKHIFDKNDVITEDDIRNVTINIFNSQANENNLAQG